MEIFYSVLDSVKVPRFVLLPSKCYTEENLDSFCVVKERIKSSWILCVVTVPCLCEHCAYGNGYLIPFSFVLSWHQGYSVHHVNSVCEKEIMKCAL